MVSPMPFEVGNSVKIGDGEGVDVDGGADGGVIVGVGADRVVGSGVACSVDKGVGEGVDVDVDGDGGGDGDVDDGNVRTGGYGDKPSYS